MGIKNGDVINLAIYEEDDLSNKAVIITEDITDITLTSNRKPCDFRIFVKKRNKDLNININNLILNSEDEIAVNFTSGKEHDYKSYLTFSGINTISSKENIGICITNNQTVEIKGEKDSFLKIRGGSGVPAIGSSFYTEGAGNIIFSGEGSVEIIAGNSNTRGENTKNLGSGCGIGFYTENIYDVSSIKIIDNIDLKIVGEDGGDIESIIEDKEAEKGGYGVQVKNTGVFEKLGSGVLEIKGGNGGSLIGDYTTGICGDGGCAISFGQGNINIDNKAILKAGHGGSVKTEYEFPMVKGGNGGDIISISQDDLDEVSQVTIGNGVEVNLGNGGNSGNFIDGKDIKGFNGGNSGSLINSNNKVVKVKIGDINIKKAVGGLGGNKDDEKNKGEDGKIQKEYLGENIEFIKFEEELENIDKVENEEQFLEDIEELQIANNDEDDSSKKEQYDKLDIENNKECETYETLQENKDTIENLKEAINNVINEDLEAKVSSEIIEENIVDVEKSEYDINVLQKAINIDENIAIKSSEKDSDITENMDLEDNNKTFNFTENIDLENENNGEIDIREEYKEGDENTKDIEEADKISIWERIKRFFTGED